MLNFHLNVLEDNDITDNENNFELTSVHISTFYVETLTRLHAECFDKPWNRSSMLDILLMPGCFGYIAMKNDVPCGLIICQITAAADEDDDEDKGEAEILTIGVSSSIQRQGIGTFLVDSAVKYAKDMGIGKLFLEVSENNPKAIALYKGLDFEQINIRPKYYRQENPPADALILAKNL